MLLRAITPIEMQRWMKLLRQYTSYAHGGDGTSTDFSVVKTKPKRNGTSLSNELDKALNQLNIIQQKQQLEQLQENIEEIDMLELNLADSAPRNGHSSVNKHRDRDTNIVPVDLNVKNGGSIIMSSDSEISLGKSYAPVPGIKSKDRSDRTLNVDSEIVIGKKSTAIVYYDISNDVDDDIQDFSVLPDEEEFKYQEQLARRTYDISSNASPKEDEYLDSLHPSANNNSISPSVASSKDTDGRKKPSGYNSNNSPENKNNVDRKSPSTYGLINNNNSKLIDLNYSDCK